MAQDNLFIAVRSDKLSKRNDVRTSNTHPLDSLFYCFLEMRKAINKHFLQVLFVSLRTHFNQKSNQNTNKEGNKQTNIALKQQIIQKIFGAF